MRANLVPRAHMPFRDTESYTEQTRSSDSWCWPKGARPLGTRMNQNQRGKRRTDRSCSTLMQMRTVKLSQIGFGYFSCNHKTIERKTISLSQRIRPNGRSIVLRACEQLRACVKWDQVDCYIFIFLITFIIILSNYFPVSDWLKPHA